MPLVAEPRLDDALQRRVHAEAAEADGEVDPAEPEVVLRAPEGDAVGRVVLRQQLVGERFDLAASASVM